MLSLQPEHAPRHTKLCFPGSNATPVCPCRPGDRAVWQAAVGAAAPPLLILCKGPAAARRLVAVRSSSLTDSSAWAAELRRHLEPNHSQGPSQGSSRPAGLFALAAAHALLAALHAASRLDLAARVCTQGLRDIVEDVSWRQWALGVLGLASLWGFKRLLDAFSATDGALFEMPLLPCVLLMCILLLLLQAMLLLSSALSCPSH